MKQILIAFLFFIVSTGVKGQTIQTDSITHWPYSLIDSIPVGGLTNTFATRITTNVEKFNTQSVTIHWYMQYSLVDSISGNTQYYNLFDGLIVLPVIMSNTFTVAQILVYQFIENYTYYNSRKLNFTYQ